MQKNIEILTPAKINLVLEILEKREDGFHNIQSIMQAVNLYDELKISVEDSSGEKIELSGNNREIPYDENNIVYKACRLFLEETGIKNKKISIYIDKNIPVSAGLAGGSSNAAGTLYGLNIIFENILAKEKIHFLASKLGSDLNFCLEGGTKIATSRGEILSPLKTPDLNIVLIKPKNLGISAKEAYINYAKLDKKPDIKLLGQMKSAIENNRDFEIYKFLNNDLEAGILPKYPEIKQVREYLLDKGCKNSLMSGSGPSVLGIYEGEIDLSDIQEGWQFFKVKTIPGGVTRR